MLTGGLIAVFWSAALVLAYVGAIFPLLIWCRARFLSRPYLRAEVEPHVSLIVVAHNEEDAIGAKIESILALDYPRERLEVLVASDGSTDRTEELVRAHAGAGIQLLGLPRLGKAAALNAAAAAATGEVLVFSDANGWLARGALRALVRPFADPAVGGVAGNQVYRRPEQAESASGELAYWSLDRRLKHWESAAGNVISATGALYAVRRALFHPIPEGVTDDFVISTRVVAQNRRLVFAPEAVVWEPVGPSSGAEFARKVRIMTRGLHAVALMRELLDPFQHGFYALQLLSHKLLRRLAVLPLLALVIVTPALWHEGVLYRAAAVVEAAILGAALLGALLRTTRFGRARALAVPFFLAVASTAALVAVSNVLRGRRIDRWSPHREGSRRAAAPAPQNRLARHDWRFLLADPCPRRVALVGGPRVTDFEALALAGGGVTVVTPGPDSHASAESFDLVVAHEPTPAELEGAARLLCPGGVLYLEDHGLLGLRRCRRGLRFRSPRGQAAALEALGLVAIETHAHWPDFASCTRIVPLARDPALLHLLGGNPRDGYRRVRNWIGWTLARCGVVELLLPCFSVLGTKPPNADLRR